MKNIEVVAGIIFYGQEILCVQRSIGKCSHVSLKWEFPGGKIENGETMQEALIREIKEELELEIEVGQKLITTQNQYPDFYLTMHCFLCKAQSKNIKLNVHKDFMWLKKQDLSSLDWAEADVSVVNKLLQKN